MTMFATLNWTVFSVEENKESQIMLGHVWVWVVQHFALLELNNLTTTDIVSFKGLRTDNKTECDSLLYLSQPDPVLIRTLF
ncbi:hypothetical protein TYRP_016425 [Tyrophagus putrescentiae]|nr:hypothetical protein TYRP_016425 [Tyrophagus putrescentiae]